MIYVLQQPTQSEDPTTVENQTTVAEGEVLEDVGEWETNAAAQNEIQREAAMTPMKLESLPAPKLDGKGITIEVWNAETRAAVPHARLLLAPKGFQSKSSAGDGEGCE